MPREIAEGLATAPCGELERDSGVKVLDLRDLVDGIGNRIDALRSRIDEAVGFLRAGQKVVLCCERGISRSNALASAVLARWQGLPFTEAVRRVKQVTGEREIKVEMLAELRAALGEEPSCASSRGDGSRALILSHSERLGEAVLRALADPERPHRAWKLEISAADDPSELGLLAWEQGIDTLLLLDDVGTGISNRQMGRRVVRLKNVLDLCNATHASLVCLSSWTMFSGYCSGPVLADESLAPRPWSRAGQAMQLCELLVDLVRQQHGLRFSLLRCATLYGEGYYCPAFLHTFVAKARLGEPIVTHRFRNGRPLLDLLHVDDLARALAAVVDKEHSGLLHLGSGQGITTHDIAERIIEALGSSSDLAQQDLQAEAALVLMDSRRAGAELGWRPCISLDEGLGRVCVRSLDKEGRCPGN